VGRLTLSILAIALGAAAAVGLVSCGGSDDDLLPGDTASEILTNLSSVEELVAEGDCEGALSAAQDVATQVERLPGSVDAELRERLAAGADQLEQVSAEDCTEPETVTTTAETTTDEPTDDEEDETEPTTPTETTDTTTTQPTTTEPTTPTQPTVPTDGSGGIEPPSDGNSGRGGGP